MACCLFFFSGDPIDDDPKASRSNRFQISMMDGLTTHQPWCCLTYLCPCCSAYYTRYRALDGDMTKYMCCQGYINCMCFRGGGCGEQSCPEFCLALESFFCLGPSMSTSRLSVMDQYNLRPDPCDNRLIRLTNCCEWYITLWFWNLWCGNIVTGQCKFFLVCVIFWQYLWESSEN